MHAFSEIGTSDSSSQAAKIDDLDRSCTVIGTKGRQPDIKTACSGRKYEQTDVRNVKTKRDVFDERVADDT